MYWVSASCELANGVFTSACCTFDQAVHEYCTITWKLATLGVHAKMVSGLVSLSFTHISPKHTHCIANFCLCEHMVNVYIASQKACVYALCTYTWGIHAHTWTKLPLVIWISFSHLFQELCRVHGRTIQLQTKEFLPSLRALQKTITRLHEDLSGFCNSNHYLLQYLCRSPSSKVLSLGSFLPKENESVYIWCNER